MSGISLHEELLFNKQEKVFWGLLITRECCKGEISDLITAYAAVVHETLSGELWDGICKRSPQSDLGLSKSCRELVQTV